MNNVIEKVANTMEEDGFLLDRHPNGGAISFRIPGRVGILDVSVFANDEISALFVYVSCFFRSRPERRLDLAEYICRANYGLNFGCLELDMSDGEIRFRVSSLMDEVNVTNNYIRRMIDIAAGTYDRYLAEQYC